MGLWAGRWLAEAGGAPEACLGARESSEPGWIRRRGPGHDAGPPP